MFRAIVVSRPSDSAAHADLVDATDDALGEGDVEIDVEYSSINYKDGIALTGAPGVIKAQSLIAGIDLVGTVSSVSEPVEGSPTTGSPTVKVGDRVIVNGHGIGENHPGGLSERARVNSDWLVPLPAGISASQAAAIGTAGFTAMLSVLAIEKQLSPADGGEVLVTGASGGVGSIAIALLSKLGYRVTASTGRAAEHDYLRSLGASDVVDRATLSEPGKPLQTQRWAAAVDSVGSHTLANVLAQTNYGGIVATCGLAQGADLPATVMPFILRAVTLTGINSVYCPRPLRLEAWGRLARDLDLGLLDSLTTSIALDEAIGVAGRIMRGDVRGRTVVRVQD
ncbi:acrylyl-CoA reductase (NADPH) [Conyzicola lurida]|uniref:Acrylyl-CoA reductase (NADPH) n=1 Tax=Conyzicola lurida TaxID=1172621 RepID=A0A841ASD0_9MICO|nr:MDR family oxidoreductase [Conyzicola lurida]MBB5844852.1 acrylyl-CoA reductase (NADPH) [Conyzicola lurida]